MNTEEYLLLAEIEYWQTMIGSRKKNLSRFAVAEMSNLHDRAVKKLLHVRDATVALPPNFKNQQTATTPN